MWQSLRGWNLVIVVIVSLATAENSSDQQISKAAKLTYEPGTDLFYVPELYRLYKAGDRKGNMSGCYTGPTFTKEFMSKPMSVERRLQSRFKLLDWKRRRKRLDPFNATDGLNVYCKVTPLKILKSFVNPTDIRKAEGKIVNLSDLIQRSDKEHNCSIDFKLNNTFMDRGKNKINSSDTKNSNPRIMEHSPKKLSQKVIDLTGVDKSGEINETAVNDLDFKNASSANQIGKQQVISLDDVNSYGKMKRTSNFEKFYTPKNYPMMRDSFYLNCRKCRNISRISRSFKGRNGKRFKRMHRIKRDDTLVKNHETKLDGNSITNQTSVLPEQLKESLIVTDVINMISPTPPLYVNDETTMIPAPSYSTEISIRSSTAGHLNVTSTESGITRKRSKLYTTKSSDATTEEMIAESRPKAKIIIGGVHLKNEITPLPEKSVLLLNPGGIHVHAVTCITPSPQALGAQATKPSSETGTQHSECHPKGAGPLSPMSYDPEAYGPMMEDELEDALTGKLADRVVDVVMAKVCKCPRMQKELGLYAQGNLTKIQYSVSHPEGKKDCEAQSSDALKNSVLQEIGHAVDKLLKTKSSGMCLKPPEDLSDFLMWLLTEDPDMDMPEPCVSMAHPRRESDYLFKAAGKSESPVEPRNMNSHYYWQEWINYLEESPEGDKMNTDGISNFHEGTVDLQTTTTKSVARFNKSRLKKKRKEKKQGEQIRRRRYTPWSLIDYP